VEDIKVKDMKVPNKKIARLEKKESRLVTKGKKAVDEGRERKADRLLGRAAKVENRVIKTRKSSGC
jgi:phage shock protein A